MNNLKRPYIPSDFEKGEEKKRRLSPTNPVQQDPSPKDAEPNQRTSTDFSCQTTKLKLCKWKPVSLQMLVKTLRALRRLPIPPSLDDIAINISSRHQVCQNIKRLSAEIELKATIAEQLGIIQKDQENRFTLDDQYLTGKLREKDLKQFWRRYYRSKYLARYLPCSDTQTEEEQSG